MGERPISNARDAVRDLEARQRGAPVERIFSNARNTVWNHQIGNQNIIKVEIARIIQRICSIIAERNATPCRKIGDIDARKVRAIIERQTSNARDAVRDRNACQRGAPGKRIFSNALNTVRDLNARE